MKWLIAVMITRFIISLFETKRTKRPVDETRNKVQVYDPATYRLRLDECAERL
ncbi:MAG: hypothetical protein IPP31_05485 [Chitinophagaceae bacterium]|nr:hypothetical protein [Chitinophagaceae bacterium]